MKKLYFAFITFFCFSAFAQIQQNVNKIAGTQSKPITEIDSIRFNVSGTQMEIILNNGNVESHNISEINNVTFSGQLSVWPFGTVHCGTPTEIVEVTNPITGKIWMDRNLGATQVATSSTDTNSYGDLYQWGRGADGHQCRNSATTASLSSIDQPSNDNFIIAAVAPNDWRSPQNDGLWQGINGVNNPCPIGFRLPTETELDAELLSWSTYDLAGAYASPLKLPLTGARSESDGSFNLAGVTGVYWSSNVSIPFSQTLIFGSGNAIIANFSRAAGISVRCIKE